MRHHVGGKEIHVPPREIVREDAELEERHENAEAGALAHPLNVAAIVKAPTIVSVLRFIDFPPFRQFLHGGILPALI